MDAVLELGSTRCHATEVQRRNLTHLFTVVALRSQAPLPLNGPHWLLCGTLWFSPTPADTDGDQRKHISPPHRESQPSLPNRNSQHTPFSKHYSTPIRSPFRHRRGWGRRLSCAFLASLGFDHLLTGDRKPHSSTLPTDGRGHLSGLRRSFIHSLKQPRSVYFLSSYSLILLPFLCTHLRNQRFLILRFFFRFSYFLFIWGSGIFWQ